MRKKVNVNVVKKYASNAEIQAIKVKVART
jgi:hypothetical protein